MCTHLLIIIVVIITPMNSITTTIVIILGNWGMWRPAGCTYLLHRGPGLLPREVVPPGLGAVGFELARLRETPALIRQAVSPTKCRHQSDSAVCVPLLPCPSYSLHSGICYRPLSPALSPRPPPAHGIAAAIPRRHHARPSLKRRREPQIRIGQCRQRLKVASVLLASSLASVSATYRNHQTGGLSAFISQGVFRARRA